ncbi:MAG: hypothetical protein H6807_12825 [Planctomycetes bacterium]|nr:hypothetical protein [Planctomycetota bacterium]
MTRLQPTLLFVLFLATTVLAQGGDGPDFGAPPKAADESATATPQDAKKPVGDAALIERLSRWPEAPGQEAARALVLEGGRVVPLLIENLRNNDWRIRCGVAWALGELREQSAFPDLQAAARDIANRISAGPFFTAMVKIDPVKATAEILGFLGSTDARVAREAYEALPTPIAAEFESRLADLARHEDATVRERALQLSRRLAKSVAADLYLNALADPATRVAALARDVLADRDDQATHDRLRSLALDGALRPAAYATLALVMIEDRSNRILLDESPTLKKRLLVFLNLRTEFENVVGAIAFANVSRRTTDPQIRAFADGGLMDVLLGAAAGGVIFRDYNAVKELCFRKAAELSGESFGEDGDRWLAWWQEHREGFRARRELRNLDGFDLAQLQFRWNRREGDQGTSLAIRMGEPSADQYQVIRPIYVGRAQMEELAEAMKRIGFFDRRGMQRDSGWSGDFVDVSVVVDGAEFRRSHYGTAPADLLDLEQTVLRIAARERWQGFCSARAAGAFRGWFLDQRRRLDGDQALAGTERVVAVAELALEAYPGLAPQSRREALAAWREAGDDWIAGAEDRFLALLKARELRPERAQELLEILQARPGLAITRAVIEAMPLFSDEGRATALGFLGRRPGAELLELDLATRPELGGVLLVALARRSAEPEVAGRLIELLSEPDPRLRQALGLAFPEGASRDLLDGLAAEIGRCEGPRRLRLIETYGRISAPDDLDLLDAWLAEGGLEQKQAVVRALAAKDSADAWERVFTVATAGEPRELRLEAQGVIATSKSTEARQRLRALLAEVGDEDRLMELVRVGAELFGDQAAAELGRFLGDERPALRRQVAVLLAPRLVTATVPELLRMLLDKTEASRAWEYLELITCREFPAISAEEAYVAYGAFWDEHKEEEQTTWFMKALEGQGMPSANLLGYLNGNPRDLRSIALLLKTLESDKWYLRANAHHHLGRIRGDALGVLVRDSSPAEVERVRNRWAEWYKALLAGL